jgi:hypothetical protein
MLSTDGSAIMLGHTDTDFRYGSLFSSLVSESTYAPLFEVTTPIMLYSNALCSRPVIPDMCSARTHL